MKIPVQIQTGHREESGHFYCHLVFTIPKVIDIDMEKTRVDMFGSNIVALHVENEEGVENEDYLIEFDSAEDARLVSLKLKARSEHEIKLDAHLIPEEIHGCKFGQCSVINSLFNH